MRWIFPLVFFLASCSSKVIYDYDPVVSFSQFDQYRYILDVSSDNYKSLDNNRIQKAITHELLNKGLQEAIEGSKALLVHYVLEEEKHLRSTGFSYSFGTFHNHFGLGTHVSPQVKEFKERKLVVELIEPLGKNVIWRAVSKRNLRENMKPNERTAFINELIAEMFQNYPPKLLPNMNQ